MYRVVLDTNVLISAIIRNGKPRQLLRKSIEENKYILVTSNDILNEMVGVLRRPKFQMSKEEISKILFALVSSSDVKVVKSRFKVVKDPDDDMIVNTAYDGETDYIVSGDGDLLRVKEFKNIKIITVKEMLKLL